MSNIDHPTEDCNRNPTANTQNNAAFNESISDGKIPVSGGEKEKDKVHGFSKKLAKLKNSNGKSLGWKAALVLRYLAAASRKYGVTIDGKKWVRVNLDHISKQYPYLGRSTVDDNILRLEQFGCLEKQNGVPQLKRRKNDRTRCYHIPKQWMNTVEEEPRYFQTGMATRFNVPTAVIHYNFCYWLGECEKRKVERRVKLSPAVLVDLLPFSESTIKRSLETLEAEKYLHPVPGKISWYAKETQKVRGSNPDRKGPNPDEEGPNPDDKGSKPDNYIYCNSIIDELEKDSKTKPAALVLVDSDDVRNANDDKNHLLHDGMMPCADEQDREQMKHDKITSHDSELIHPSACDMTGEAFDVKGSWPDVPNHEYLHRLNQSYSRAVKEMEDIPGVRQSLLSTVHTICGEVLLRIDQCITDQLYENGDNEEIVRTLLPYHQKFFDTSNLTTEHRLFEILYYGSLEAMVGAFLWDHDRINKYSHPLSMLNNVTYQLHLVLWRQAENLRLKAVDEERDQRREEFASRDEDKEKDASLTPAEKTRVFRNGLHAMNQVGWIFFDQTLRTNKIQVTKLGCQRIQKLFELNPQLTPADLLPIMDKCIQAYGSRPALPKKFERKELWHARMGHRLHMFASYLKVIVKDLEIASPVEVYLSRDKPEAEDLALAA